MNSSFEKYTKEPPRDKNKPNKYSKTFSGNLDHLVEDKEILHYANKAKKNTENDKQTSKKIESQPVSESPEKRKKEDRVSDAAQKEGFLKDKISTYLPDDLNYTEWRYEF